MLPVRQSFPRCPAVDISAALTSGFSGLGALDLEGKRIAITGGSRGIKGIADVLRGTVKELKSRQAHPFVVPAMGSHGGASAEGQRKVLESIGIDEARLGVPIQSSMDVVALGTTGNGLEVFCDKHAHEADGIVVCNRIKAHTTFKGTYESGLVKMLVIIKSPASKNENDVITAKSASENRRSRITEQGNSREIFMALGRNTVIHQKQIHITPSRCKIIQPFELWITVFRDEVGEM